MEADELMERIIAKFGHTPSEQIALRWCLEDLMCKVRDDVLEIIELEVLMDKHRDEH